MRVAYVCADPGVPVFGCKGCSVHVQEMVRAMTGRGVHVDLFVANVGGVPPPDLEAVQVNRLPAPPKGGVASREQAAVSANRHLHTVLEGYGPFDLVYERYSLWSFCGMEYARDHATPGVLEVNAPLIEEQAEHRGLADRVHAERVAERAFAAATALIAVSGAVAVYLERCPAARGRIHVVPNGVNPERVCAGLKPACSGPPGSFTVGFVGTLKPWHGLSILVEAFAVLNQRDRAARLLIVGDGPERAKLEADLTGRGLAAAVHLTGLVSPDSVPGLLASMDVAVAPYPELPGFYFSPLKVYEYMAAGLPVVASQIGDLPGLIQHEVNGLLCPPGEPRALAEALDRLRQDPEMRKRLGNEARTTVLCHHTWDHVVGRVFQVAGLAPSPRRLCPAEVEN